MSDKSKIVKELALKGLFDEVESRYGKKARAKAEAYRSKKDRESGAPTPKAAPSLLVLSKPGHKSSKKSAGGEASAVSADAIVTPTKAAKPSKPTTSRQKAAPKSATPATAVKTPKLKAATADAKRPTMPMSAFFRFCAERRPSVKKTDPELKTTDIGKLLGAEWRALSAGERAVSSCRFCDQCAVFKPLA
jgi:hypothetical protein